MKNSSIFQNNDEIIARNNNSIKESKSETYNENNRMLYKIIDRNKKEIAFRCSENSIKPIKKRKIKYINVDKSIDNNSSRLDNQRNLSIYTHNINNNNISVSASFNNGFLNSETIPCKINRNNSLSNSYVFRGAEKYNNHTYTEISHKAPKTQKIEEGRSRVNIRRNMKIKNSDLFNNSNPRNTFNYTSFEGFNNSKSNLFEKEKTLFIKKKSNKNFSYDLKNNIKNDLKNKFSIKKENTTSRKITTSIVKTEKTIFLPPDSEIKTLTITEIKKDPETEIFINKNGVRTKRIKKDHITIIKENKKIEIPKIKMKKNLLFKQIITKKSETEIITIRDNRINNEIKTSKNISSNILKNFKNEKNEINKNNNKNKKDKKNKKIKLKNRSSKDNRHKINFDMPKDIDFKKIENLETNDNEINEPNSLLDDTESKNKTKSKKINKLMEFITKLNDSSSKNILSNSEELNIISIKKNNKKEKENEDEEMELSLQKEIELRTVGDEQNEIQDNEIKSNNIIPVEKENIKNKYENEDSCLDIDEDEDLTERFLINDNRKYINNIQLYNNIKNKPKDNINNIKKNSDIKIDLPKIESNIFSNPDESFELNEIKRTDNYDKFFVPLTKYEMSCGLNGKNPFRNEC